eukprot:TRINITY_DN78260_c0_g1_i1.p1 TRINITY_DN78260_c0_g1~~TRINITY_DN78260_c0_g1_i1.p1  ORF type:complete len:268 (+),score=68.64 TRINITY_DN78260_c0_g1_i1:68-871(+)
MPTLEEMVQMDSLYNVFTRADADGNGTWSRGELRNALRSLGVKGLTDERIDSIFRAMDADGGGDINYLEFVRWLFRHPKESEAETIMRPIAGLGSGPTNAHEALQEFMEAVKDMKDAEVPEGQKALKLKDVFKKLDTNASGSITMSEFKAAMKSVIGYDIDSTILRDVFGAIDTETKRKKKVKRLSPERQQEMIAAAEAAGVDPPRFQDGIPEGDISKFVAATHDRVLYRGHHSKKQGKVVYDPFFEAKPDHEITFAEFKKAFEAAF